MATNTFFAPADARDCKIYGEECLVYNNKVIAVWDMLVGYIQLDCMPCPVSTYRRRARRQMLQDVARDLSIWAGYRVPHALSIVQGIDASMQPMRRMLADDLDPMICISPADGRVWVQTVDYDTEKDLCRAGVIMLGAWLNSKKDNLRGFTWRLGLALHRRHYYPDLWARLTQDQD